MSIKDTIAEKIQLLPDSFAEEVANFIDFLLMKRDKTRWSRSAGWIQFADSLGIGDSDFSDYLSNLQDYEERLARGEIKW